jgi:flagellar motor switch protein FliM
MLTQAEIDALLAGAIEIETHEGTDSVNLAELMSQTAPAMKAQGTEKKVQAYNFWSPDRFSKDQMRAVELVYEDLTERMTTSMPSFLRVNLRPRLVHSEQGRFHDFLKDFPNNSLFHMITLAPLPGQTVLTISPDIAHQILEQRLGCKLESTKRERPMTDIDQNLLRGLVEHMLNDLKAAWSKVAAIEPALEDSTVNQHWVQMMMGNERGMLLTFEMVLPGGTGTMNIYIPFSTLKPIANVLNPHIFITGRKERMQDPASRAAVYDNLAEVVLPVKVVLGNAQVSLDEVLHLSLGDVIKLDTNVGQDLIMQVADRTRFWVKVGKSRNHLAVQLQSVCHTKSSSNLITG